ncbi:MAG: GAF domain-containing protein [Pseudomonadota bacterium]
MPGGSQELYANLHREISGKLFTVTVLDRNAGFARRVYSSCPETYPVSGTKPMAQGAWTDQVIVRGETFVANSVAEFAPYFADCAVIETLGCASALNVPVGQDQVIGTVNVLDVAGFFTPERVRHCEHVIAERLTDVIAVMTAEQASL